MSELKRPMHMRKRPATRGPKAYAWGAAAIGRVIERNAKDTAYLLGKRYIKSAFKVGNLWCAEIERLRAEFAGKTAAE
jgi:hypothetical protein